MLLTGVKINIARWYLCQKDDNSTQRKLYLFCANLYNIQHTHIHTHMLYIPTAQLRPTYSWTLSSKSSNLSASLIHSFIHWINIYERILCARHCQEYQTKKKSLHCFLFSSPSQLSLFQCLVYHSLSQPYRREREDEQKLLGDVHRGYVMISMWNNSDRLYHFK